ncbi:unnamed protein product [Sympodiomycopsis kandeliae]
MSSSVQVSNIAAKTSKKALEDFFSFCGSITSLDVTPDGNDKQKATITFAKESAASTAAMLHGGTLDGSPLTVQSPGAGTTLGGAATSAGAAQPSSADAHTVGQEDKPRTAIVAEILAHGYSLSDDVTKRAIDLDNKHGLSDRFKGYLSQLDRTLGERIIKGTSKEPITGRTEGTPSGPAAAESVSEKSAEATPVPGVTGSNEAKFATTVPQPDSKTETTSEGTSQQPSLLRHVQDQVQTQLDRPEIKSKTDFAWSKLTEYYNAIANHPRIHDLYTKTSKSVTDVHEEARRIAEERKKGGASGAAGTSAPTPQA